MPKNEVSDASAQTSLFQKIVGILAAVAGFVVFAAVSAAPVVALSAALGGLKAFVVMSLVYGVGSYVIILAVAGIIDRHLGGEPTRAQKWVEAQKEHNTRADGSKKLMFRLAEGGGFVGFAIACYFLGAIITVLILNYTVKFRNLKFMAASGSLIFSVGFCATYTGLFSLIFH